jgi:hypothetical protein
VISNKRNFVTRIPSNTNVGVGSNKDQRELLSGLYNEAVHNEPQTSILVIAEGDN